jgi:hypothetical protein
MQEREKREKEEKEREKAAKKEAKEREKEREKEKEKEKGTKEISRAQQLREDPSIADRLRAFISPRGTFRVRASTFYELTCASSSDDVYAEHHRPGGYASTARDLLRIPHAGADMRAHAKQPSTPTAASSGALPLNASQTSLHHHSASQPMPAGSLPTPPRPTSSQSPTPSSVRFSSALRFRAPAAF